MQIINYLRHAYTYTHADTSVLSTGNSSFFIHSLFLSLAFMGNDVCSFSQSADYIVLDLTKRFSIVLLIQFTVHLLTQPAELFCLTFNRDISKIALAQYIIIR